MAAMGPVQSASRFKASGARRMANVAFRPECLRKSPFFADRSTAFLEEIIQELEVEIFQADEVIVKQGDVGDKMYFLYCGEVDILVGPQQDKVASLSGGTVFGEMALFGSGKRMATVRASGFCDCRVIAGRAFNWILRRYPEDRQFFVNMAQERGAAMEKQNAQATRKGKTVTSKIKRKLRQQLAEAEAMGASKSGCSEASEMVPTASGLTRSPNDSSVSPPGTPPSHRARRSSAWHVKVTAVTAIRGMPPRPASVEPQQLEPLAKLPGRSSSVVPSLRTASKTSRIMPSILPPSLPLSSPFQRASLSAWVDKALETRTDAPLEPVVPTAEKPTGRPSYPRRATLLQSNRYKGGKRVSCPSPAPSGRGSACSSRASTKTPSEVGPFEDLEDRVAVPHGRPQIQISW